MTLESRRGRLEDPGAELLDRAQGLWARYGRIALIAAGVVVVVGAGWFFMQRTRSASEAQAAGRLAEANALFWQGQYARSFEVAKRVREQYPSTPSGLDAYRLAGDAAFWNGDTKTAVSEYRAYLDRQKSGLLASTVRRSLAYSLESENQFAEAARTYESLVGVFDRESSAEFLSAAARCYQAMGKRAEAIQQLERLLNEYGDTIYATPARVRIAELKAASGG